jgi:hypothetical protein
VPTDDVLAGTSISEGSLPAGTFTLTVTFTFPATVAAGKQYALVLSRPNSGGGIIVGHRVGNDYPAGQLFSSPGYVGGFVCESDFDMVLATHISF